MSMIPFNKPFIAGKELYYISQAVLGRKLAGDGRFTRSCQRWMEEKFGAEKVLLTHSCTAALEMSAILAGIEPGDKVIMPSYAFVSTANSFALRGGKICFIDMREDTKKIESSILGLDSPYMGARTGYAGDVVILEKAKSVDDVAFEIRQPGKVWSITEKREPVVVCGEGMLRIEKALLNGKPLIPFSKLRVRFGA